MELWRLMGELHPKLVQFPLVLLLVGLLFDAVGLARRSARAHWAGMCLTVMGTLGLLFAFICGIYAEIWAGRAGIPQHPIEIHELLANVSSWGFVILLAWRIFLRPEMRRRMAAYVAAGLVWYVLLGTTAYFGGQLVFQYGAAVTGAQANSALTLEDLNTLASRQTDENLRYSEWMHHIFGWMTLGLGVSLLAQAVFPRRGAKLRWIVPAFLLAGGIFLFFMADRDLYALTDWRQWRDREVQLHKTLGAIMTVIGAAGLWRLSRRRAIHEREEAEVKSQKSEATAGNSKLVAVLALIGGALLFTHVHTVAPYANVAAGVYIAHMVMGLVALGIGASRLAQDYLPRQRGSLAVAFALLMTAESVLLIAYNEGLPWFIGYGTYNRWGPGHDRTATVAPYGPLRAVLRVDVATGTAIVDVLDRDTDRPVAIPADRPLYLRIARGYEEMALLLLAGERGAVSSHFTGQADFLKTAATFSARLTLPVNGRMVMGFFDPWVTPVIAAVPANELAKYQCPMHEGIRSTEPGVCPLCGMEMQPIRLPRPAGELHDAAYSLHADVTATQDVPLRASITVDLTKAEASGDVDVPLALVHEHYVHLIIVSEDLAYFDHVHPVQVEDSASAKGLFRLAYTFPRAGRYLLFADMTPKGDREQVFRIPLNVSVGSAEISRDEAAARNVLTSDDSPGKLVAPVTAGQTPSDPAPLDLSLIPMSAANASAEKIQVHLLSQPRTLYAGLHTDLLFRLADQMGRPITDLSPYLGAMGHCVIISEDTMQYLHCHPEQLFTPQADDRGGPDIAFHTLFPKAGRYRIWGQFKRKEPGGADKLIIGVWTVEVKNPPVPASWIRFLLNE